LSPEKIVGTIEFHDSNKELFRSHRIEDVLDIFKDIAAHS